MQIGDEPIFRISCFDRDGVLTDPSQIIGAVEIGNASTRITFVKVSTGVYEGVYEVTESGDHWLRIEASGNVKAAIEKRFKVAERKVLTIQ